MSAFQEEMITQTRAYYFSNFVRDKYIITTPPNTITSRIAKPMGLPQLSMKAM